MDGQRIIMFCGADMCGKTQIAKELSRRIGVPYFKATSEHDTYLSSKLPRGEAFIQQLRHADPRLFDVLRQTGYSLVFDRAYPCEWVYSKVMHRETDHEMLDHMDEMWASLGTVIVICYRSSYAGIVDDLDSKINADVLQELTDTYFDFAKLTRCKVLNLNVDDEDLNREINEILEFIK